MKSRAKVGLNVFKEVKERILALKVGLVGLFYYCCIDKSGIKKPHFQGYVVAKNGILIQFINVQVYTLLEAARDIFCYKYQYKTC